MWGTLFGVGVGPGDPDLITFKAAKILRRAPVVAYTVDEAQNSFARQVAASFIPPTAVHLPLQYSMSPRREIRLAARREAARQVSDVLAAGSDVAFITEGDPLLYSTFQHLLAELPASLRVEICPGVSAFTAAAAAARFPLALEDQQVLITTGSRLAGAEWAEWRRQFDVIVVYKIHRHLEQLVQDLRQAGCLDRAVLVERASQTGQVVVRNVLDWDGRQPPYFSLLLLPGGSPEEGER